MRKVVQPTIDKTTNKHYNFEVAKPLVSKYNTYSTGRLKYSRGDLIDGSSVVDNDIGGVSGVKGRVGTVVHDDVWPPHLTRWYSSVR